MKEKEILIEHTEQLGWNVYRHEGDESQKVFVEHITEMTPLQELITKHKKEGYVTRIIPFKSSPSE